MCTRYNLFLKINIGLLFLEFRIKFLLVITSIRSEGAQLPLLQVLIISLTIRETIIVEKSRTK